MFYKYRLLIYRVVIVLTISLIYWGCTPAQRFTTDGQQQPQKKRYYRTDTTVEKTVPSSGEVFQVGAIFKWNTSFYAADFHGEKTANGEIYDMYGLTCAHKELPFNTVLKVTNPVTGQNVTVRVNDRGPFIEGRDLDLSYGAAGQLGLIDAGTMYLDVEIIEMN